MPAYCIVCMRVPFDGAAGMLVLLEPDVAKGLVDRGDAVLAEQARAIDPPRERSITFERSGITNAIEAATVRDVH